MAHQPVPQTSSAYPRNPASAAKHKQRAPAPVLKTRRSRRSLVGRVRNRMGSSLKRARLQTGLNLLEYPYSLFCSTERSRISSWVLRIEKTLIFSKSKGPLKRVSDRVQTLHFNTTVPVMPFGA